MISPAGSTMLYRRFVQPLLREREQVHRTEGISSWICYTLLGNRSINRTNQTERLFDNTRSNE